MTSTPIQVTDMINAILGADEGSAIAQLRARHPENAEQLQAYYDAIFNPVPESEATFSVAYRFLVAIRVASHTGSEAVVGWYTDRAREAGVTDADLYPVLDLERQWDGDSVLDAAIRHADWLTIRPADASPEALQALKDAGLSPAGIVSLSQTIAFVSYQLRLIAGLRVLGGNA
jgi:CMD domain protein